MTSPEWEAANEDDSDRFPQTSQESTESHERGSQVAPYPERVARYAEALGVLADDSPAFARILAVADEERAALVAELKQVRRQWHQEVENFERETLRAEAAEAEVERLREDLSIEVALHEEMTKRWRDQTDAAKSWWEAALAAEAKVAKVAALHVPWYEVNGVRHDHLVHVTGSQNVPADHVCRVGDEWDRCEIDTEDSGWSVHVVPACYECRAATEDGDLGYLLWPCATIRALADAPAEQRDGA